MEELKFWEIYNTDGCLPSPDDDRDFTCAYIAASKGLPEEYIVPKKMSVLNQGSVGSCVAHACATALGYGELKSGKEANNYSRGFIYGNRRDTDHQGEGMYIRQALKQLNHCGDVLYEDFPWNEKYPEVKKRVDENKDYYLSKAEPYKVINYFRCYTNEEVKETLLNQGAVVMSITLYDSFSGECPIPGPEDKKRGGHAMCLVGWDKTGWIIQNSWSAGWGNKGLLHLPYEYPVNEWWGITVNDNLPQPKKRNFFENFWAWLKSLLKRIFK